MVLAVALVAVRFFPGSASAAAPPPAVTTAAETSSAARPARPGKNSGGKKLNIAPRNLDPTLRYDWLRASEDTKYEGAGRNIFQVQVEIPQPVAPAVPQQQVAQGPPPPPPPPPINLKFFGF